MSNPLLYLSYTGILLLWGLSPYVLIPYTFNVVALVSCILYAASHHSLVLREEQERAKRSNQVSKLYCSLDLQIRIIIAKDSI